MIRTTLAASVLATFVLAPAAFAQTEAATKKPLDARAFVPASYRAEIAIDMKAARELELIDGLRTSPIGMFFPKMEQGFGFSLDEVDTVRVFPPVEGEAPVDGQRARPLAIFQGSDKIKLPPTDGPVRNLVAETMAGHDVVAQREAFYGDDPDIWVLPRAGVLIVGAKHHVEPVLEGKGKPGVPSAEFLSLATGKNVIASVVIELTDSALAEAVGALPSGAMSDDDKVRFLQVRLRNEPGASEGDDPVVVLEATVRCDNGKASPPLILAAAQQGIEAAKKHPRLAALKRFWSKVELKVDGRDVIARLPLGKPRDAAGNLAMLVGPLMMVGTTVEAQPVQVAPAAVPAPATEPVKPAGNGGGK